MAVTKTPRKKPVTALVAEEKPATKAAVKAAAKAAAKAKAAPAKKAAAKVAAPVRAEPVAAPVTVESSAAKPVAKAKGAPKAPAKTKTGKAVEASPAASAPEAVESKPEEKKAAAPAAAPAITPASLPPLAQAVLSAICEGRAVEFIFADAEANAPRTFEPRHLTFDALSRAWYVWGWDRRYNAERHHRVDLLAEVNPVEGMGRAAQGPCAEGTPANLIGGWLGGDPIQVKATLLKQWVFAVKQAPPAFPNFKIEEQGDGQALVSFSATDLRAIARWAMQFGDGIQVLEPARLVDRIKQVGAVWAGRERQASPAAQPSHLSAHQAAHQPAHQAGHQSSPKAAPRPEPAPEPRRHDARPPRDHRPEREEAPKAKPGKVEVIRFDRL